jgi:hypothetical protein
MLAVSITRAGQQQIEEDVERKGNKEHVDVTPPKCSR